MIRVVLVAALLALAPLSASSQQAPSPAEPSASAEDSDRDPWRELLNRLSQSDLKEHLAAGVENVQRDCASDIRSFCGQITPGEGRMLLCMRDHEHQLSRRCLFSLYRASRNLERAVELATETCWNDIQMQCGSADQIGQCVAQKSGSLSPACRTIVAALRLTPEVSALQGKPVYSSDDKNIGQVVEIVRGPDGKVQAIQVETSAALGLGSRVVAINADMFDQLADRIRLRMSGDEIRTLPATRQQ